MVSQLLGRNILGVLICFVYQFDAVLCICQVPVMRLSTAHMNVDTCLQDDSCIK